MPRLIVRGFTISPASVGQALCNSTVPQNRPWRFSVLFGSLGLFPLFLAATIISMMTSLFSCSEAPPRPTEDPRRFVVPHILQALDTTVMDTTPVVHLADAQAIFRGKFQFGDTIDLITQPEPDRQQDLVWEPLWGYGGDSIAIDGLQLVADHSCTMRPLLWYASKSAHYPVFLFNETFRPKFLSGKDSRVFAIQEALDAEGTWRPIEGLPYDFCGNGRWGIWIHPGEFVMFSMRRHSGTFRTKLRVRLVNGEATYFSQPFEGSINFKQFLVQPEGYFEEQLTADPIRAISRIFHGSVPMSYDAHRR